jgi:Family of unknown function (DUF6521)
MTALLPWNTRPDLAATILNPALIAATIGWASKKYSDVAHRPMPWELCFLVVPVVLHQTTRNALPSTTRTHLTVWVNERQEVLVSLPERARKFRPHVLEGLRFGLRSGLIVLTEDASLMGRIPSNAKLRESSELRSILGASAVLGGIFAKTGTPANIYSLFGVSP